MACVLVGSIEACSRGAEYKGYVMHADTIHHLINVWAVVEGST